MAANKRQSSSAESLSRIEKSRRNLAKTPEDYQDFSEPTTWRDWLMLLVALGICGINFVVFARFITHFGGAVIFGFSELIVFLIFAWILNARSVYHFTERFLRKKPR